MTDSSLDRLVDDWLARLERAAADLPADRRAELVSDLREHIAVSRADLAVESEAQVRTILERLGDPATIAGEARQDPPPAGPATQGQATQGQATQGPATPGLPEASMPSTDRPVRRRRNGLWITVAVVVVGVLCLGCAVAGFAAYGTFGVREGVRPGPQVTEAPWAPSPQPSPIVSPDQGR